MSEREESINACITFMQIQAEALNISLIPKKTPKGTLSIAVHDHETGKEYWIAKEREQG